MSKARHMFTTLRKSHEEISTLKDRASKKIPPMYRTLEVSHDEMSPLNDWAERNALAIVVTDDVCQELRL